MLRAAGWNRLSLVVLMASVMLLGLGLTGFAQRLPGDYLHEVRVGGPETPHTKWAKPYARGSLRVFFLTPFTAAAREATELWQRMDLRVFGETTMETTMLSRETGCFSDVLDTRPAEKLARMRRKLEDRYDVLVCGNFRFGALPLELQYRILEKVAQGAGLVFVYPHDARADLFRHPADGASQITSGVPFAGLPYFTTTFLKNAGVKSVADVPGRVVQTYTLKRGRVAVIDYAAACDIRPCGGGPGLTPMEPFSFDVPTYYDYYLSLVAKAILWAANKSPEVHIIGLPPDGKGIVAGELPRTVTLTLKNDLAESLAATMTVRIRDPLGVNEALTTLKATLKPGNNDAALALPALKGGVHFVDVMVSSKRGQEDWASVSLRVQPPVEIGEVTMDAPSFLAGAGATGAVSLATPVPQKPVYRLRVLGLDNYGREFAQREYPLSPGTGSVRFELPLAGAVSLAGRARVQVLARRTVVDQKERLFVVDKPTLHEYPAMMWGRIPGILGHYAQQRLREAGFCAHLTGPDAATASQLALDDLRLVPYCYRIGEGGLSLEPKARQAAVQRVSEIARELRDYHPLIYSLGDENYIPPDFGFKSEDRPAFREFVRRKYGTLQALNQAWRTKLTSLDEAEPVPLSAAKAEKQYTQFHDTEAFREFCYADMHHLLAEAIRKEAPGARVGAEGSETRDLEQTIGRLEFWGPYRNLYDNTLLRSLAPRELVRGNWFGGYRSQRNTPLYLPNFLWDSFLDGNNLIEYFAVNTVECIFNTDLSWAYWTEWFWPDFQQILNGLGQAMAASDYDDEGVAIHHSQSCWHASALDGTLTNIGADNEGLLRLLNDLGAQHSYLPRSAIEADALRKRGVRLLFLPYSQAVSSREAEGVRAFVEAGGVVVADVRPGVMDEECHPLPSGQLDDLFGVRQGQAPQPKTGTARIEGSLRGSEKTVGEPLSLKAVTADASLTVETGKALGNCEGIPAVVTNRAGKGMAVLLNFPFGVYGVGDERGLALQELTRQLLLAAGVTQGAKVVGADGNLVAGCRIARFRRGKTKLLGALLHPEGTTSTPVAATLELAQSANVHDIRAGRSLGFKRSLSVTLQPAHASVFGLLPYTVSRLEVKVPSRAEAGKPLSVGLQLVTEGKARPEGHVVRLNVFGPDGKERRFYAQTLYPKAEQIQAAVPFALNDDAGTWEVCGRDVVTGVTGKGRVSLRPPSGLSR